MLSLAKVRRCKGFTLIEALIGMGVAAILASVAYPSCVDQLRKGRRIDAVARLAQLQLAQEAWRANSRGYGTLADVRVAAETASGLYRISVTDVSPTGYTALAQATGTQAADARCRYLRLSVAGGNAQYASGADPAVDNAPALNQRCWNL